MDLQKFFRPPIYILRLFSFEVLLSMPGHVADGEWWLTAVVVKKPQNRQLCQFPPTHPPSILGQVVKWIPYHLHSLRGKAIPFLITFPLPRQLQDSEKGFWQWHFTQSWCYHVKFVKKDQQCSAYTLYVLSSYSPYILGTETMPGWWKCKPEVVSLWPKMLWRRSFPRLGPNFSGNWVLTRGTQCQRGAHCQRGTQCQRGAQTEPENIVVHNPTQQSVSICVTEEAQRMIQRAIQKRVNKWKPPTEVERLANRKILYARGLNHQF